MAELSEQQQAFVDSIPVARMATADRNGVPHVVPVCFVVLGDCLYVTVDEKPKATSRPLKRVRNILENSRVSVIVDRYDDDWSRLAWVMLHGSAEILAAGEEHDNAQTLLAGRYSQYREMDLSPLPVIAMRISRVASWGNLSVAGRGR
ncbi:MAG: TIGR03668 family PPOX class F420-dependent oxidoreductase [Hyphomicrobiaceae bacterium]